MYHTSEKVKNMAGNFVQLEATSKNNSLFCRARSLQQDGFWTTIIQPIKVFNVLNFKVKDSQTE